MSEFRDAHSRDSGVAPRGEPTRDLLGTPTTREGAAIIGGATRLGNEGPGPRLMTADTLTGDAVVNAHGEKLGVLKHIMLDVAAGRIAYAVLSSGGVLGLGDQLYAIPWHALTLDPDHKCFILDVDRSRFEQAPGFDKDHWPSMADERWASEVHRFYGQQPYWAFGEHDAVDAPRTRENEP